MKSSYFAKILLFGEYGIIRDTMGLSIPYRNFWGNLSLPSKDSNENHLRSNNELKKFFSHLKELEVNGSLIASLRLEELSKDLQDGLYFESTIPQGYGVGSSGALVAAVYDRYSNNQLTLDNGISPDSIQKVKECLGQMESYFHGKSSGIDPTICYLQLPLLIRSQTEPSCCRPLKVTEMEQFFYLTLEHQEKRNRWLISLWKNLKRKVSERL